MKQNHQIPAGIQVRGARVHNLKHAGVDVPLNQIVAAAGVSGSGKTTLILESLIPGMIAAAGGRKLPKHVRSVEAQGIRQVKRIDAAPMSESMSAPLYFRR